MIIRLQLPRLAIAFLLAWATPRLDAQQVGLLVVAHGSVREWNDGVRATVAQVHWSRGPVETAFLMGEDVPAAGWDSAVARLVRRGAGEIVVVPLMVSSYGGHYRQVQHYAGLPVPLPEELAAHGHGAMATPVRMRVTPALDAASELGEALAERWIALDSADRARAAVFVAHGPTTDADAARWMDALATVGERLRTAGLRQDFRIGLLRDDAPAPMRAAAIALLRDTVLALAARTGDSVVALPVMIAAGPITRVRIPQDLAGLPVRYARVPLSPHPAIARWIERSAIEALAGTQASR